MRWPVLLTVVLLAGCAGPAAPTATLPADDGAVVAIRIIPINHTVTWQEPLEARPCGLPNAEPCEPLRTSTDSAESRPQVGVAAPEQERRAIDSGAPLWRLSGTLDIQESTANPEVQLRVYVTKPTGGEREVLRSSDRDLIVLERTDVFLKQGERDLRFVLAIQQDYLSTVVEPVRVHGELLAQAYIDAGDEPVILD